MTLEDKVICVQCRWYVHRDNRDQHFCSKHNRGVATKTCYVTGKQVALPLVQCATLNPTGKCREYETKEKVD